MRIYAAGPDPPDILRQPENAVPIGAAEIGLDHQSCDDRRVRRRDAGGQQGVGDKLFEAVR
jgi:hypothetical protein